MSAKEVKIEEMIAFHNEAHENLRNEIKNGKMLERQIIDSSARIQVALLEKNSITEKYQEILKTKDKNRSSLYK